MNRCLAVTRGLSCLLLILLSPYARSADPSLPEPVGALQQLFGMPVEKLGRLFVVEDAWVGAVQALLKMQGNA